MRIDAENDAAGRELAAIHDEIDDAAAPGKARRFQVTRRLHDRLDHFVLKRWVYSTERMASPDALLGCVFMATSIGPACVCDELSNMNSSPEPDLL